MKRFLLAKLCTVAITAFVMMTICLEAQAQPADANYDEAKVPKYTLPDPLVMQSGQPVKDAETWRNQRRPEILHLFQENVYGKSPGRPPAMSFETDSIDEKVRW